MKEELFYNYTNPTNYERTEWFLVGKKEKTEKSILDLPESHIECIKIDMEPRVANDTVYVPNYKYEENFKLHENILSALRQPFQPEAKFTKSGDWVPFELKDILLTSSQCSVQLWTARDKDGIAELILYLFNDYPIIKYELSFYCESLYSLHKIMDYNFRVEDPTKKFSNLDTRAGVYIHNKTYSKGFYTGSQVDGQGKRYDGALIFYNLFSFATDPYLDTYFSFLENKAECLASWEHSWGPFNREVPILMADFGDERALAISNSKKSDESYIGKILHKRPADTGGQPDFGVWQHIFCVDYTSPELLLYSRESVKRETCRPIHFFEKDGNLVKAEKHPNLVTLAENIHWDRNTSPDRLGRTYKESLNEGSDWFGRDRQHYSVNWLTENFLLTGSFASYREMQHIIERLLSGETLPSEKPGFFTNNPGPGRAVGRVYLGATKLYLSTGDKRILDKMNARFKECVYPKFSSRKLDFGSAYYTVKLVGYHDLRPSWVVWEDAIMVMGLYAYSQLKDVPDAIKADMLDMAKQVSLRVFEDGYAPDNKIYSAIALVGPPDPMKSDNTDYSLWALPMLRFLQEHCKEEVNNDLLVKRINNIQNTYKGDRLEYLTRFDIPMK